MYHCQYMSDHERLLGVTIEWKCHKKATSVYDLGCLHVLPLLLFNNQSVFTYFRWTLFVAPLAVFFQHPTLWFCLVCINARTSPGVNATTHRCLNPSFQCCHVQIPTLAVFATWEHMRTTGSMRYYTPERYSRLSASHYASCFGINCEIFHENLSNVS